MGRPFGIELRLHVLFFITMLLAILSQAWVGPYAVAWAVTLAGPVLLVTIYLHELGHCLASKAVRVLTYTPPRTVHPLQLAILINATDTPCDIHFASSASVRSPNAF